MARLLARTAGALAVLIAAWIGPGTAWPAGLPSKAPESLAVNFDIPSKNKPVALPAWSFQGTLYVSVKSAMDELDGEIAWQAATRKAVLRGPSGNTVELTLGQPRMLVNGRKLVRLPSVPRLSQGRVLVSLDALAVIWKSLENQAASFDPATHSFLVGPRPAPVAKKSESAPAPSSVRLKGLVIVDAGHGGKDPGAIGPSRLQEKEVVLAIALKLRKELEAMGLRVLMTRADDTFIPLPKRCEIANRAKATLFVSIHANAAVNRKACGSEVYIYNREASSRKAAETARLENQEVNYLEIIKDDLRQSVYEEDSITVGGLVAQAFTRGGRPIREIERAPFFVLAKSHMPSILVETAFISNHEEEHQFRDRDFCDNLAGMVGQGIRNYFQEKNRKK